MRGYEASQAMRRLETAVREQKGMKAMYQASGDKLAVRECNERIKRYQDKYKEISDITGIAQDKKRMTLTKSADSGKIKSENKSIISSRIDSPIERRNTSKGNPNAVLHVGASLNNRQQNLLNNLPSYDSRVTVNKKSVNMKDLSALTAHTGDEFAMFTKGKERIIVRGNKTSVNIDVEQATELSKQGYKWSGHTHPGIDDFCTQISDGDIDIWNCFSQNNLAIYNSKGVYRIYVK